MSIFRSHSSGSFNFTQLVPVDLRPDDIVLVKDVIGFITNDSDGDVKLSLWSHSKVEATVIYLLGHYDSEAKAKVRIADRMFHDTRERWMNGSGFTVARVESLATKDPLYQTALQEAEAASNRSEYIKNLTYAVKNRLRALEQLANNERLEQRLDSHDAQ
jgi:hypothetical protein